MDAMMMGPFSKKRPSSACLWAVIHLAKSQRECRSITLEVMVE